VKRAGGPFSKENMGKQTGSKTVINDPITEEEGVIYLLASMSDYFSTLVTAFEANSESVLKMELLIEYKYYTKN